MKILTLSDTHGYPFKKIKKMLDKAGFCEKDFLYVLGDTIDRGNGHDMLHFLRFILAHPNNVELIIGNHERMALDNVCLFEEPCKHMSELSVLEKKRYRLWMANGGEPTLEMLKGLNPSELKQIIDLFRKAPLFREIYIGEKRFILCHSGLGKFDPFKPLDLYLERELTWYRPEYNERWYIDSKSTVVYGHTPTPLMNAHNKGEVIIQPTWINVDTGSALGEPFHPTLFCLNDYSSFRPD